MLLFYIYFSFHLIPVLIPPKKTVILFKKSIEIYSSGIHKNIEGWTFFWCGKEDDKDEFINTLKNIDYNCDNIIYFKWHQLEIVINIF